MVAALVCQGLIECHLAAQGNALRATIVATLAHIQVDIRAQAATQQQNLDS